MSRQKASEETRPADQPLAVTGPPANVTLVGVRIFGKDRLVVDAKGAAPAKPPVPIRPGMPQPPQAFGWPAAGVQTMSPAAGLGVRPPTPGVVPPRPPMAGVPAPVAPVPQNPQNQNPQIQQLPADVRQKLEHMKQNPGNSRSGRSRR
ncbi:MAG: hypothetical protein E6J68_11195 [Deltaproteobacteria bacterium]|nr:MAG: hypothetical protein E6J68_11195 [Deltaproteobacteria bacterium]